MEIAYMLAYTPHASTTTQSTVPVVSSAASDDNDHDVSQSTPFPPGIFDDEPHTSSAFAVTLSDTAVSLPGSLHPGYVNAGFASPSISATTLTSLPAYSASVETSMTTSVSIIQLDDPPRHDILSTPRGVRVDLETTSSGRGTRTPSTHHRDRLRRTTRSTQPGQRRQRSPAESNTAAVERGAGRSRCCRYKGCSLCCTRCLLVATSVKFMLVSMAIFGTGSVVVGIGLGALNMVVGSNFLTLSLIFIGAGVVMVILVGVLWRCVPTDHEPCHRLLHIEQRLPVDVYGGGRGGAGGDASRSGGSSGFRFLHTNRNQQWSGGIIYPEFNYGAPPPSYDASLVDRRPSFDVVMSIPVTTPTTTTTAIHHVESESELAPPTVADEVSLPSSTPPSYRSRASSIRSSRGGILPGIRWRRAINVVRFRTDDDDQCTSPPGYHTTNVSTLCLEQTSDREEHRSTDDDHLVPDSSTSQFSAAGGVVGESLVENVPSIVVGDGSFVGKNSPEAESMSRHPMPDSGYRRTSTDGNEQFRYPKVVPLATLRYSDNVTSSRRQSIECIERVPDVRVERCVRYDTGGTEPDEQVEHL